MLIYIFFLFNFLLLNIADETVTKGITDIVNPNTLIDNFELIMNILSVENNDKKISGKINNNMAIGKYSSTDNFIPCTIIFLISFLFLSLLTNICITVAIFIDNLKNKNRYTVTTLRVARLKVSM